MCDLQCFVASCAESLLTYVIKKQQFYSHYTGWAQIGHYVTAYIFKTTEPIYVLFGTIQHGIINKAR